ncbi:MAG TPA: hypothetical protein VJ464_16820 [Blastocatellia bacterium]|nr:hypothetical protein [Blastocatellia bacterium]
MSSDPQQQGGDFQGLFGQLNGEFKSRFGRDLFVTASDNEEHRKLHPGGAADVRARDLSSDERRFVTSRAPQLGLNVRDYSWVTKPFVTSNGITISGPHIHLDADRPGTRPQPSPGQAAPAQTNFEAALSGMGLQSPGAASSGWVKERPAVSPTPGNAPQSSFESALSKMGISAPATVEVEHPMYTAAVNEVAQTAGVHPDRARQFLDSKPGKKAYPNLPKSQSVPAPTPSLTTDDLMPATSKAGPKVIYADELADYAKQHGYQDSDITTPRRGITRHVTGEENAATDLYNQGYTIMQRVKPSTNEETASAGPTSSQQPMRPTAAGEPSAVYSPAPFDPFSGKPTVHLAPAPTGPRPQDEPAPHRGANVLAGPRLGMRLVQRGTDELGRGVYVEEPEALIPGENIKDEAALDQRLGELAKMRGDLLTQPAEQAGPSLALVDEKIRHLSQVKNDLARIRSGGAQSPQAPSQGGRPADRPEDLPWYLKGHAANVASGVQSGVAGLGDVIYGWEKMLGVTPSPEFKPAIESGHEYAAYSAQRGGEGVLPEFERGAGHLAVDLPLLAAGGIPAMAVEGAGAAAADPRATPDSVGFAAAQNAALGAAMHAGSVLSVPKRVLLGATLFGGTTAAEGGTREQVISQALLGGGLGVFGGKRVRTPDGQVYEVVGENHDAVELKPVSGLSAEGAKMSEAEAAAIRQRDSAYQGAPSPQSEATAPAAAPPADEPMGMTPGISGTTSLSNEELSRAERFFKVGRGADVTSLGKQPDAPLRPGEAVVAIGPDGAARVVNSAGQVDQRQAIAKAQATLKQQSTLSVGEQAMEKATPALVEQVESTPLREVAAKSGLGPKDAAKGVNDVLADHAREFSPEATAVKRGLLKEQGGANGTSVPQRTAFESALQEMDLGPASTASPERAMRPTERPAAPTSSSPEMAIGDRTHFERALDEMAGGQKKQQVQPSVIEPEVLADVPHEIAVSVKGEPRRVTVTTKRADDGQYEVTKVKLHNDQTGRYELYTPPDNRFATAEEARAAVFDQVKRGVQGKIEGGAAAGIARGGEAGQRPALSTGNEATATTERGTQIKTRYKVVEADSLIASHDAAGNPNPRYPQEVQPRDRSRLASEEQVNNMARNLRPEFLGESPKASDGAPIVGPDSVVESGNGRVMALRRVYERHPENAANYRGFVADQADRLGLDRAAVERVKNPVLVRERLTPVDRAQFAREANEQATASMSAVEQARSDAAKLDEGLMSNFRPSDSGEVLTAGNRGFVGRFLEHVVGPAERGRYVTADGQVSQEGANRIRNAIFAKAYADTPEGVAALEKLAESTDSNVKNITTAMLQNAGGFASLKKAIGAGVRYPVDIAGDIAAAMKKLSALREQGTSVDEYLRQGGLFGDELTGLQKEILSVFDKNKRSAKVIGEILDNYLRVADAAGDPKQQSFFSKIEPTKGAFFEAAVEEATNGQGKQAGLFTEQERSQAGRGNGAHADQKVEAKGPEAPAAREQAENVAPPTLKEPRSPIAGSGERIQGGERELSKPAAEFVEKHALPKEEIKRAIERELDEDAPAFVRDARRRLLESLAGNKLSANPLHVFYDTALVTAYDVYKGAKDFSAWSKEMVNRLGEKVRPHLEDIFDDLKGFGPRQVLARLKSARLIPDSVVAEALAGDRPGYLKDVADFITEQRQKVVKGSLTLRDVAKAYYMTVASQGATAIKAETLRAKMKAAGIKLDLPNEYLTANKKGDLMIRPEEAAGAWLLSPHGQRALADLERGVFNEKLWAEAARVREAFGDDRLAKNNVLGEARRGTFNMRNLATAVAQMNEAKGNTIRLQAAGSKLNGIGVGKVGFLKHLLGFGDSPTIDAVEINWWLTGKGHIANLKTRQAEFARAIKDFTGNVKLSRAVAERINSRFSQLRESGRVAPDIPDEAFNHVLHQWIWDKAKGEVNTHTGMYAAMREPEFVARSRERMRESLSGNRLNSNPVRDLYDAAIVTGYDLYKSVKDFSTWSRRMAEEFGPEVKEHLQTVWQQLTGQADARQPRIQQELPGEPVDFGGGGDARAAKGQRTLFQTAPVPEGEPMAKGVKLTEEGRKAIRDAWDEVMRDEPPAGPSQPSSGNGGAKHTAGEAYLEESDGPKKTSFSDKLLALRRTNELMNLRTLAKVVIGHGAAMPAEELSRAIATIPDVLMAGFKRGRSLTAMDFGAMARAGYEGATKGVKEAANILRHGDPSGIPEMSREIPDGNPLFRLWVNGSRRVYGAALQPERVLAIRRAMEERARLWAESEARQGTIKPSEVRARTRELIGGDKDPSATARISLDAMADAEYVTYRNQNAFVKKLRDAAEVFSPRARQVLDQATLFMNTPANVVEMNLKYTPIGGAADVWGAVKEWKANGPSAEARRQLSMAMGRMGVGAAAFAFGYYLSGQGQMQGMLSTPVSDAEGHWRSAVHIPGTNIWLPVLHLGPVGALMTLGATVRQAVDKNRHKEEDGAEPTTARDVVSAAAKALVAEHPTAKLVTDAADLIEKPGENLGRFSVSQARTLLPGDSALREAAALTDDKEREAKGAEQEFKKGTPGLRQTLPAKRDVLGREIPSKSLPGEVFNYDTDRSTPALDEMNRLGVSINQPKAKAGESAEALDKRAAGSGQLVGERLDMLVESQAYQKLDDRMKRAVLRAATAEARSDFEKSEGKKLPDKEAAGFNLEVLAARVLAENELKGSRDYQALNDDQRKRVKDSLVKMFSSIRVRAKNEVRDGRADLRELLLDLKGAVRDTIRDVKEGRDDER